MRSLKATREPAVFYLFHRSSKVGLVNNKQSCRVDEQTYGLNVDWRQTIVKGLLPISPTFVLDNGGNVRPMQSVLVNHTAQLFIIHDLCHHIKWWTNCIKSFVIKIITTQSSEKKPSLLCISSFRWIEFLNIFVWTTFFSLNLFSCNFWLFVFGPMCIRLIEDTKESNDISHKLQMHKSLIKISGLYAVPCLIAALLQVSMKEHEKQSTNIWSI